MRGLRQRWVRVRIGCKVTVEGQVYDVGFRIKVRARVAAGSPVRP